MKHKALMIAAALATAGVSQAQKPLTPEMLWQLGRVSAESVTPDGKDVIYGVTYYDITENKSEKNLYRIPVSGGTAQQLTTGEGGESVVHIDNQSGTIIYLHKGQLWQLSPGGSEPTQLTEYPEPLHNVRLSPDGKHILFTQAVPLQEIHSTDRHADLPKSDAYVYDALDYRHWDTWADGSYHHVFYATYNDGELGMPIDIMADEPYHTPQQPFGGREDVIWSPDGRGILYVSKKSVGTAYAQTTNTDIYRYELATATTINLTEGMVGYDQAPAYSPDGQRLAWLSMAEDGYESDKNDIVVFDKKASQRYNLTKDWDGTVNGYQWSNNGRTIWFTAAVKGTVQLFEIHLPNNLGDATARQISQISQGQHDIASIVGQAGNQLVVSFTNMNHAAELYRFDLASHQLTKITSVNDERYAGIAKSKVEARISKATDGKDLLSWIIYPPDFDPAKKYPTLLYCQGGPQGALSQFYSYRWNFQLIAAQGYIVVAPNRRGMPGYGVEWNEQISGDWGGQAIDDYLSAIDDMAKEPYVDTDRLGAVGASYGGYSVFMLAGVHENRFKTFIAHDGLFDMRSWYGTTEELFFANKDLGGPYWDERNAKTYTDFNPITRVDQWNTPIMIVQGGKDYRVGIEQGLEAFQAAQLRGIKSRLLYLPDENHWVLSAQNALVWQREFFRWLKETL
ncbi:S9 family peptidase [Parapedobacter sp. 10938]|uniref:S9 family peptidase n=1 Tax=Parapedobacter flavus TaxID=3110225 RepID=UPI002DB7BC77|nr:S9 family peptidase [Parapedobacter sp. 10938]MEC3880940.1 S9 family peptidase [Parapedobacter sp. 10938]